VLVIQFAASLCLFIALALGAVLVLAQKRRYEARATRAALETVPLKWFCWGSDRADLNISGKAPG
jgi:hypothetical protein